MVRTKKVNVEQGLDSRPVCKWMLNFSGFILSLLALHSRQVSSPIPAQQSTITEQKTGFILIGGSGVTVRMEKITLQ